MAHKLWSKERLAETTSTIRSGARQLGVKGASWLPDGPLQDAIALIVAKIDEKPSVDTTDTPANGEVLTYDSASGKYKPSPSGSAPVSSVFARTGAVVAASGDYTASQVTNTPAGNIAATTVQAAINELDTEKLGSVSAGQVSNTPAGNIAATTVQAALNELDSEKAPAQPFPDNTALVKDDIDATKQLRVDVGSIATGTTRVLTMPNSDVTLANVPAVATQTQANAGTDDATIMTPQKVRDVRARGAVIAGKSVAQAVTANVDTKCTLPVETLDNDAWFDNATNYRFTPQLAGLYEFFFMISYTSTATGLYGQSYVKKNGATVIARAPTQLSTGAGQALYCSGSGMVSLNGTTDYIEVWGITNMANFENESYLQARFAGKTS